MVNMDMKPLAMNTCSIDTKGLDNDAVIKKTKCLVLQPTVNVDVSPPIGQVVNTECSSKTDTKVVIKLGLDGCEPRSVTNLDLDKRNMYQNMVPLTDMDKQFKSGSGSYMDNKDKVLVYYVYELCNA